MNDRDFYFLIYRELCEYEKIILRDNAPERALLFNAGVPEIRQAILDIVEPCGRLTREDFKKGSKFSLRTSLKDLMLDLEATGRENEYLREMMERGES